VTAGYCLMGAGIGAGIVCGWRSLGIFGFVFGGQGYESLFARPDLERAGKRIQGWQCFGFICCLESRLVSLFLASS